MLLELVLLTRLVMIWVADHPRYYQSEMIHAAGDVQLYGYYGHAILAGRVPYRDVKIEYPPAALPFIAVPSIASPTGDAYRIRFAVLMALVDVLGLLGIYRITQRTGSTLGLWAWAILLPLLGPLAYLRYDILPAVATIWACERAYARRWTGAGGWLGAATALKLYPALLVPAAVVAVQRRWRLLLAAGAMVVGSVAVMGPVALDAALGVVEYHAARGVHVESTWGGALLAAAGGKARVVLDHGAYSVLNNAGWIRPLSLLLTIGVVAWSATVMRRAPRDDAHTLSTVWLGTLCAVLAVGVVLSPQYLCWVIALTTVVVASPRTPRRGVLLAVGAATLLTQALFPFLYAELLRGEPLAVAVLLARNLLLGGIGVVLLTSARAGSLDR